MNQWVQEQSETGHHRTAIYSFPLVVFLGYLHPVLFIGGLILFFLITSFKMLKSMLLWMVVLGVISFVLPFLAPIIFIIMVVLFIMRIGYIWKNWRPFVSGILFYGISAGLIGRSEYLHSYQFYGIQTSTITEGVIVSIISFFALNGLLRWLYRHDYTSYAALGIMGSVPVIIVAFILPFLKLHVGGDFFATETKPVHGEVYMETKTATGEPIGTRAVTAGEPPLVHVQEHVRTAPDGDPTNNLSYDGPDKKAPNGELVHVQEHVRTAPDGDPTNNLSYRGDGDQTVVAMDSEAATEEPKTTKEKIIENAQAATPGQAAVDQLLRKLKEEEKEKVSS
ncbi:hypothetical protein [Thalassobacillus hwangdonensis]|uniref:Uncharacterized protein n=1 Tax=Thalassobacillus hwangdonensis TaxID=546108 RepID=A0ABW3L2E4_9BACI